MTQPIKEVGDTAVLQEHASVIESIAIKNWSTFEPDPYSSFPRDYSKLPYCCGEASRPLRADDVIGLIFEASGKFPMQIQAREHRDFSRKGKEMLRALPPKVLFFDHHAEEHFFKILSIGDDRTMVLKPVFMDTAHTVIHKIKEVKVPFAMSVPKEFFELDDCFYNFVFGDDAMGLGTVRTDAHIFGDLEDLTRVLYTAWTASKNEVHADTFAAANLKKNADEFMKHTQFTFNEELSPRFIEQVAAMKAWLDDKDAPERASLLSVYGGDESQLAQLRAAFEAAENAKEVYSRALAAFIDGLPHTIENVEIEYSGKERAKMAPPLIDPRKVLEVVNDDEGDLLKLADEKNVWRVYTDDGNAPRRKNNMSKDEDGTNGRKGVLDDTEADATERMTLSGFTTTWSGNLLSETMEEKEALVTHLREGNVVRVMLQNAAPYAHILRRLDKYRCLAQLYEIYGCRYGDTVLVIDLRAVSEVPLEWDGNEQLVEKLGPLQRDEGFSCTGFRREPSAEREDFTCEGLYFE